MLFPVLLYAQNLPLSHEIEVDYQLLQKEQTPLSVTAIHPWIIQIPDSIIKTEGSSWLTRKLFKEHLFIKNDETVKLSIDPLFNFTGGYEREHGKKTWMNTRGFIMRGKIGDHLTFETSFLESQAVFASYLDLYVHKTGVIPGSGRVHFGNNQSYFDYQMANGYLSYTPNKIFNFQLGTGKNFIGEGYRSLLLSDQSFNYPFLRITTSFWHIKYTNLYAQLQDSVFTSNPNRIFKKKYTTMHLLSWDVTKNFNIGFFEAIVWADKDSSANRGFEVNYLNPVIFLRPVEFSIGSPDNTMMGFMSSYRINKTTIYGQMMLDEFSMKDVLAGNGWFSNKQAYQIGIKSLEPFNIKGLYLLAEFNHVRPYTYSHETRLTNYGHYNEPLTDPLGANFKEWIGLIRYKKGKWIGEAKLITALYGLDENGKDYGKDIFKSYYNYVQWFGNRTGQGLRTTLLYTDLQCRYVINPTIHFEVVCGLKYRKESNNYFSQRDNEFYVGIRTSLSNLYGEF